jgi:hypothetical protein
MILNACDFSAPPGGGDLKALDAFYKGLYKANVRCVGRYLWHDVYPNGKGISSDERKIALDNGIGIWYNYEGYSNNWRGGSGQGKTDGSLAHQYAATVGAPDVPVYYALDQDLVTKTDFATGADYVFAADSSEHEGRAYGEFDAMEYIKRPGFQTYAWSGVVGHVSQYTAVYQWHNGQYIAGGQVDYGQVTNAATLGAEWPNGKGPEVAEVTNEQLGTAIADLKADLIHMQRAVVSLLSSGHAMEPTIFDKTHHPAAVNILGETRQNTRDILAAVKALEAKK